MYSYPYQRCDPGTSNVSKPAPNGGNYGARPSLETGIFDVRSLRVAARLVVGEHTSASLGIHAMFEKTSGEREIQGMATARAGIEAWGSSI